MSPQGRATVSRRLLAWFDRAKRDLPWRREPSAYRTLVSEFMLQQTVVATVIPYFQRFMARFPDIATLARAREEEVLASWSGLGYYARARNLHRAAQAALAQHGGALPADEEALRALPGVGPYTAAAIAAISFGVRTFALDGNAARVMARLFGVDESIDRPDVRLRLRAEGQSLVPAARAGDFVQAVMELGALVCVSGPPRCHLCPVASSCAARLHGREQEIPVRTPKRPRRVVQLSCAAVSREGRILLVERPKGQLLAGTWALPSAERGPSETDAAASLRAVEAVGLSAVGDARAAGAIRHVFTHRDVTATVFHVQVQGEPVRGSVRWVHADELNALALSSFARKTLALLG